jgi:hypothetical protein
VLREARQGYDGAPLVYEAEDILVTVDSWLERIGQPVRTVAGLIVGAADLSGAEADLDNLDGERMDEMFTRTPINELGNFVFSGVSPGEHRLVLRLPAAGLQIEINNLAVN